MHILSVYAEPDSLMLTLLEKLGKTGDVIIGNHIKDPATNLVEIQIAASDFAWELLTAMSEAGVVF